MRVCKIRGFHLGLTGIEACKRFLVDQQVDGLTDTVVLDAGILLPIGRADLIEDEEAHIVRGQQVALNVGVLCLDVVGDRDIVHSVAIREVQIACDHGSNDCVVAAGRVAGKQDVFDARRLAPVIFVAHAGEIVREGDLIDLIRTGAERLFPEATGIKVCRGNTLKSVLGQNGDLRDTDHKAAARCRQLHRHGVAVHADAGQHLGTFVHDRIGTFNAADLRLTDCRIGIRNIAPE